MAYTKRSDGRKMDELRPIRAQVGVIPNADGSALFAHGDTVAIAPLFTKQAKAHADKTMNPVNSKAKWFNSNSYGKTIYNLDLDAVAALYSATKD